MQSEAELCVSKYVVFHAQHSYFGAVCKMEHYTFVCTFHGCQVMIIEIGMVTLIKRCHAEWGQLMIMMLVKYHC